MKEQKGWRPMTPEEEKRIGDALWQSPGGGRGRERYLVHRARLEERERVPWFPLVRR